MSQQPLGTGFSWVLGQASTSPQLGPQQGENSYRWATVTQVSPLFIRLDGDTLPLPLVPESLLEFPPVLNQRVWVQLFGRRVIVLGASGGSSDPAVTALAATVAALGTQTAFTPSYTNVILGTGAVNEGWYSQIGKTVFWGFRTQFGTGASISGGVQLLLPVTAWATGGNGLQATVGSWIMRNDDDGSGNSEHFSGSIGIFSAGGTNVSFAGAWDNGATVRPSTRITTAKPFTVAINDVLSGSGTYRAA